MKLNKIFFPAPKSSYDANSLLGEIVYIPRNALLADLHQKMEKINGKTTASFSSILISQNSYDDLSKPLKQANLTTSYNKSSTSYGISLSSNGRSQYIPCLFLPYQSGSSKLLIYFHGNAEDIGLSYEMLDHLKQSLKINILAVEYPGYGIYKDQGGCNSEKITEDCDYIYQYLLQETGLREKDIIIFGRSMGSGPGTYLSAHHNPGALILMSPYTSIKNIARNKVGFLSFIVAEHFDNLKLMPKVKCPTFIVHGQKDTLIPYEHAQQLNDQCGGQTYLVLPTEMTHNDFDFYQDLIKPIFQFLLQIKMNTGPNKRISKVVFKEHLYIPPDEAANQDLMKNFMGYNNRSRSQHPGQVDMASTRMSVNTQKLQQHDLICEKEESKYQSQLDISNVKSVSKNSQVSGKYEISPKKRTPKQIVVGKVIPPPDDYKQINVDTSLIKKIKLNNFQKQSGKQEESKGNRFEQHIRISTAGDRRRNKQQDF